MKILLTNDDSHTSPLLAFIIHELKKLGELVVVAPKLEQSWKGKSITRFGYLHQEEIEIAGHKSYTIDGTPADCVNIGIHHICAEKKPDLVVSGINAGLNAGVGFIWSSGTVGACLEANISGIPAVALSQHFDNETFNTYLATYLISDSILQRLETQTKNILSTLLPKLISELGKSARPLTYSVNFPFIINSETKVKPCSSGYSLYGNCFKRSALEIGGQTKGKIARFEHHIDEVTEDTSPDCDSRVLSEGHITVSTIDIGQVGQISELRRRRLEENLS